jgi:hypothetical protein
MMPEPFSESFLLFSRLFHTHLLSFIAYLPDSNSVCPPSNTPATPTIHPRSPRHSRVPASHWIVPVLRTPQPTGCIQGLRICPSKWVWKLVFRLGREYENFNEPVSSVVSTSTPSSFSQISPYPLSPPPSSTLPFLRPSSPQTHPPTSKPANTSNVPHTSVFSPAQHKLGHAYEFAGPPFPFDAILSVQHYSLASQQGEPEADMALSKWFLCGSGGLLWRMTAASSPLISRSSSLSCCNYRYLYFFSGLPLDPGANTDILAMSLQRKPGRGRWLRGF